MCTTLKVIALLAVCATAFAIPAVRAPDSEFGYVHVITSPTGNTPPGWYVSTDPDANGDTSHFRYYLDATGQGIDFGDFRGRFCEMEGVLEEYAVDDLRGRAGVYDLFHVMRIVTAPEDALRQPILDDLADRGVDFMRDGTSKPGGGLNEDLTCKFGERVVWLPLVVPPGADRFNTSAVTCLDGGVYWALMSGGFAGTSHWVGPFDLPGVEFVPSRVKPKRVQTKRKVRRKTLKIYRAGVTLPPRKPVAYEPTDFDFGPGITVTEVRRMNRRRIKVRVEIAPDAEAGMRHVSVRGRTAQDAFEVRPRRKR